MKKQTIFTTMEEDVKKSNLDEITKQKLFKNILNLKNQKVNLMITGATGSGKSSTINAMFDMDIAKVGMSVNPETMDIQKYELNNLILWDSPGLGDGKENDERHSAKIVSKLKEVDEDGNPLVDLVVVILDGGSRDLGTSYELINSVIIPNLGKNAEDRILIAINQADVAMSGRYWDYEANKPLPKLVQFLEDKVKSVKKRVKEATGLEVEPIYYSAGYKDDDEEQNPYNLSKLLYFIVSNIPPIKRLVVPDNLSTDENVFKDDDKEDGTYREDTTKSILETVTKYATIGAGMGGKVGAIFGSTGERIGKAVGGAIGVAIGFISSWF